MRMVGTTLVLVGIIGMGPVKPLMAEDKQGEDSFRSHCSICHATDGSGNTAIAKKQKVRDLRSPDVQKASDAEWFDLISKGKKPMPAFAGTLSDEKIHHVIAYVRELGGKK